MRVQAINEGKKTHAVTRLNSLATRLNCPPSPHILDTITGSATDYKILREAKGKDFQIQHRVNMRGIKIKKGLLGSCSTYMELIRTTSGERKNRVFLWHGGREEGREGRRDTTEKEKGC